MKLDISKSNAFKWLVIFAGMIVLAQLFFTNINKNQIENLVYDTGILGPLFIIIFIGLSEIFAPIPGSPGILISMTLFGWEKTMIYSYLGLLIAVCVNFWISRVFGRKILQAAFGNKTLAKIDTFTTKQGKTALIVARTLGYPFSDFISYAAGLSNMSFKTYFLISAPLLALSNLAFLWVFKNFGFNKPLDFIIWFSVVGFFGISFWAIIKRYYQE